MFYLPFFQVLRTLMSYDYQLTEQLANYDLYKNDATVSHFYSSCTELSVILKTLIPFSLIVILMELFCRIYQNINFVMERSWHFTLCLPQNI